jgi:hypothetical protein
VCEHIDEVQDAIGRRILIENPSTYIAFASSTMSETDFIRAITCRTGCGLLLDVSNVFVSATNHGYAALDYVSDFPLAEVGEIHLAGHAEQSDDEGERLLIELSGTVRFPRGPSCGQKRLRPRPFSTGSLRRLL